MLKQEEDLLEQPRLRLTCAVRSGGLTELRQQPGQLPGRAARQHPGDPGGTEITHELAKHRGKRGEREAVGAELEAAARQHAHTRPARSPGELAH